MVEQADVAQAFLVVVKDFGGIGDGLMARVIAKRGMEKTERDVAGFPRWKEEERNTYRGKGVAVGCGTVVRFLLLLLQKKKAES